MATKRYTLKRVKSAPSTGGLDLAKLNPQQRAVVTSPPGHALVIAGAGSGKTQTLVYRVAQLIDQGVAPDRILLLTFTNRAAREMTSRVSVLLEGTTSGIWSGTFHSVGRRILRRHANLLGYPAEFTILDVEDANGLLQQAMADVVGKSQVRLPKPNTVRQILSKAVNTEQSIREVLAISYPSFAHLEDIIHAVLTAYQARKFQAGAMDYDDLLLHWRQLFMDHPELEAQYAKRFEHVLVDEYQDTNRLQAELVERMAGHHHNLMVVGDDCQSIYAFRGAEYHNILDFAQRHDATTTYRLERNYRSSPQIVALANLSISHNQLQHEKTLFSHEPDGPLPAVVTCRNEEQEGAFVAQRILELLDEGVGLSQIAVLYRAHWMSMKLQTDLNRVGIPYAVRSGLRFFEQRHIKDVLSFVRFVLNPADELAFLRLARMGEGIGTKTAARLYEAVMARGGVSAVADPEVAKVLSSRARPAWGVISDLLLRLDGQPSRQDAGMALDVIWELFYESYMKRAFPGETQRAEEIATLSDYASQLGPMDTFLDSLALEGPIAGVDIQGSDVEDEGHVVLSTIHQAKGLEFNTVFVIEVAEDRFPSARVITAEGLEEERRLFYVATTRAQRELYLTRPMMAYNRQNGMVVLRPSEFLSELTDANPPVYEHWEIAE